MENKHKRILWILNHTTLRSFEVELLIALGFEVFTPKILPKEIFELSTTIDYSYDPLLSLPPEILKKLNQHDFYMQPLTQEIKDIINSYFNVVICAFYPYLVMQMVNFFKGAILLRAFGIANGLQYTHLLDEYCPGLIQKIELNKNRIWFAQAYPHMADQEQSILRSIAVTLPLGIPTKKLKNKDSWEGKTNKLLFFCPKINNSEYYKNIYIQFKKEMRDIPHIIAGGQIKTVDDPAVLGFIPDEELLKVIQDCKVMFYHSQEKFHLHYHPLEAILYGMPVIYLKGGALDRLLGDNQPGACKNYREARGKINQILKGDYTFIAEVKKYQNKILEYFSWDYNLKKWTKNFLGKIIKKECMNQPGKKLNQKMKIGVFLPQPYLGGSVVGAKNIAKMLLNGGKQLGDNVEVVFSYRDHPVYDLCTFKDLVEIGIHLRKTEWCSVHREEIAASFVYSQNKNHLSSDFYWLPKDGISNFTDCDFWLIISDRVEYPVAPLKPYAHLIYDYIQRYIPDIFGENDDYWKVIFEGGLLNSVRNANFILTTTPSTANDLKNYAGVDPSKIILVPTDFNPPSLIPLREKNENYFIWPTNLAIHKNHLTAISALHKYYVNYNGRLKVVATGPSTENLTLPINEGEQFGVCPNYLQKIRNSFKKNPEVIENLTAVGHLPLQGYINLLANAKFLWHPTTIDNGTFSVIEAAYYGVPSLSSNYAQMQYLNERFKLNMIFFNARDADEMAEKLKEMEKSYLIKKDELPDKLLFQQYSSEKNAPDFWQLIRQKVYGN